MSLISESLTSVFCSHILIHMCAHGPGERCRFSLPFADHGGKILEVPKTKFGCCNFMGEPEASLVCRLFSLCPTPFPDAFSAHLYSVLCRGTLMPVACISTASCWLTAMSIWSRETVAGHQRVEGEDKWKTLSMISASARWPRLRLPALTQLW